MANKRNWFFGGKNTKKDSETVEPNGLEINTLGINNMTAEVLNISLGVNNLTADTLNLSLEVNDMTKANSNDSSQAQQPKAVEPKETSNSSQTNSNINVVQLDIESIVNDINLNRHEDTNELDTTTEDTTPKPQVIQDTFTPIEVKLKEIVEVEEEVDLEDEEVDHTIVTYDYVPKRLRYPSEFTDTITINNLNFKILEDYGETNGLRVYSIQNNMMMRCKFLWYSKERFKNYRLAEDTLEYITTHEDTRKSIFVPNEILKTDTGFGYVTPATAKGYFSFKSIAKNKHRFNKVSAIEDTAINLVKLFKELNTHDLHLYNFDERSLIINTSNGDISMDVVSTFTRLDTIKRSVTYEYLAPETNTDGTLSEQSTCYSLMVILFKLIYHEHPLDGYNVVMDTSLTDHMRWYAKDALFSMHSKDDSNHPVRGVHYQLLGYWNKYPNYIKNVFCTFFESMLHSPEDRYTYDSMLLSFKHVKMMTFSCECGHADFLQNLRFNGTGFQCPKCGRDVNYIYFDSTKRSIPIKSDSKVYLSFVTKSYEKDSEIGVIVPDKSDDNVYGLKNLTNIPWNYSSSNGVTQIIEPNGVATLVDETIIDIGYTRILVNSTKF